MMNYRQELSGPWKIDDSIINSLYFEALRKFEYSWKFVVMSFVKKMIFNSCCFIVEYGAFADEQFCHMIIVNTLCCW